MPRAAPAPAAAQPTPELERADGGAATLARRAALPAARNQNGNLETGALTPHAGAADCSLPPVRAAGGALAATVMEAAFRRARAAACMQARLEAEWPHGVPVSGVGNQASS